MQNGNCTIELQSAQPRTYALISALLVSLLFAVKDSYTRLSMSIFSKQHHYQAKQVYECQFGS